MKPNLSLSLALAGTLLIGCASFKNDLVLDTIGPGPGPVASTNSGAGTLMVYSAYKVNADFNYPDVTRREYSDYRVLDSDKKLLKRVHNVSRPLRGPVSVELPAGKYYVDTRSNGYGRVTIPVVISSGQNTVIHLDGGDAWPDESVLNATNAVRLPDGEVVGWKSPSGF